MIPGRAAPTVGARLARRVAIVAALVALGACGDGTPAFCTPLAEVADLAALADAIDASDGTRARAEAERLVALADDAPTEIRSDLAALADAVVDIVDLLEADADTSSAEDSAPPAEIERRRANLNERLGELDRRSTRVSTWAATECGIDLD